MSEPHFHYGWMVTILIIFGVSTYIFTVNRPDVDNFGKGSTKIEQHNSPFSHIISIGEGGCAHLSQMPKAKVKK